MLFLIQCYPNYIVSLYDYNQCSSKNKMTAYRHQRQNANLSIIFEF